MEPFTASPAQRPFPLPGDIRATKLRPFWRAAAAQVLGEAEAGSSAYRELAKHWPNMTTRAATLPATTTQSGWASQLAGGIKVADVLSDLAPRSAAAILFERGALIDMSGVTIVNIPVPSVTLVPSFIQEGSPIPVGQDTLAATVLGPPRKLVLIQAFTSELSRLSAQPVEEIISRTMRQAASRQLDAAVFSATAADATRPAGILAGLVALTASSGGGINAMVGDVRLLANELAADGFGDEILYFTDMGHAETLRVHATPALADRVIGSPAIAIGTIIAVAPGGVATGFGTEPEISTVRETTLHFDTAPAQIGVVGAPNVVAAPTRSLFQTDAIALRMILRLAWVAAPGSVAYITSATW